MLNDDLLFFHKTSIGSISRMQASDWIHANEGDSKKMWDAMLMFQTLIEQTNPKQEDFQEVIDSNVLMGMDEHLELFTTLPYTQAIQKLYQFPEKEWGANCWVLLEFFTKFDQKQFKNFCRNGCAHEWHNLNKMIRTEDLLGLVGFYTSLGMKFNHNVRHNGEHYQGFLGQSELLIYRVTKWSIKQAGFNFHLRYRVPNFDEVIDSLRKRQIAVTIGPAENGIGLMAELKDPDGRMVTLYNTI